MEVCLFVPCYVDQCWPQAGKAAVRLIEALGHGVRIAEAVCCGQVFCNSGAMDEARALGELWARAHAGMGDVVVLSSSCTGHLQRTLQGSPVREFCQWYCENGPREFPRRIDRCFALHHSCSSMREVGNRAAVSALLARVPGLEVREAERGDECCGFGGSFATAFPEVSIRMGREKVADLCARGGEGILSADCSCLLHLKALAPPETGFHHVAEILWEASQ